MRWLATAAIPGDTRVSTESASWLDKIVNLRVAALKKVGLGKFHKNSVVSRGGGGTFREEM